MVSSPVADVAGRRRPCATTPSRPCAARDRRDRAKRSSSGARSASYYLKQMAQEALMPYLDGRALHNRVAVGPRLSTRISACEPEARRRNVRLDSVAYDSPARPHRRHQHTRPRRHPRPKSVVELPAQGPRVSFPTSRETPSWTSRRPPPLPAPSVHPPAVQRSLRRPPLSRRRRSAGAGIRRRRHPVDGRGSRPAAAVGPPGSATDRLAPAERAWKTSGSSAAMPASSPRPATSCRSGTWPPASSRRCCPSRPG